MGPHPYQVCMYEDLVLCPMLSGPCSNCALFSNSTLCMTMQCHFVLDHEDLALCRGYLHHDAAVYYLLIVQSVLETSQYH